MIRIKEGTGHELHHFPNPGRADRLDGELIMRTDAQQGALLNVGVGVVGSLLGAWFIAPMFGSGTINQNDFSATGLMSSLLGAVILLAVVNLFRRGRAR